MADEERSRAPRSAPRPQRGDDQEGDENQDRRRSYGRRDRYQRRQRRCLYCTDRNARIDYKNANDLRQYLTDHGKIRPRRQTALCARHQREVAAAIKRARHLALLPFVIDIRGRR